VSNRISPSVQLEEQRLKDGNSRVPSLQRGPKLDTEAAEIAPYAAGLSIALVELPTLEKVRNHNQFDTVWNAIDDRSDTFSMQIGAKSLELGRQQNRIGSVHLLGSETSSPTGSADPPKRAFDLVEASRPLAPPFA